MNKQRENIDFHEKGMTSNTFKEEQTFEEQFKEANS